MSSCQRCSETYNGPEAFLLTCRGCRKTWHHRCLMPPMGDQDLIQLIRATNAADTANDLNSWVCRRCRKHASEAPSVVSSRETTVSHDSKSWTTSRTSLPATDTASTATGPTSKIDFRVKQELSTAVTPPLAIHRERSNKSGRQESTDRALAKKTFSDKRMKSSAANQSHVQRQARSSAMDVPVPDATSTKVPLPDKKTSSKGLYPATQPHLVKAARKFGSTVSTTSSEDGDQMQVDPPTFSEFTSRATSQASPAPASTRPDFVAGAPPHVDAVSATSEREVRPAGGAAIQPQVNQVAADEVDDDPEDLYGPPVERRIIRILPSLAEELREQQRRVAAEKEKRRAPLAPDWILARHVNDPLWKERTATAGRKPRKPAATMLRDGGYNVNELMGYFTVQDWVREHKI